MGPKVVYHCIGLQLCGLSITPTSSFGATDLSWSRKVTAKPQMHNIQLWYNATEYVYYYLFHVRLPVCKLVSYLLSALAFLAMSFEVQSTRLLDGLD